MPTQITKKFKITPLANRLIVRRDSQEDKTASGIIIPKNAKEQLLSGEVVAVGAGERDEPMTVKVNDKVMFGQYAGTDITLNGEKLLIMRENDIYGIVSIEP